jgi:ferrous iron transport protein B
MRLSELHTGERGVVVKVLGHGGFRKRIVEMGFIKGKVVEVLLNAPLKDPVKYKIMNYEISLRHEEAAMIEIISMDEARRLEATKQGIKLPESQGSIEENETLTDEELKQLALSKRRTINVALVGNPNCGKTSLFNLASGGHERVGNYSGVTVDAKTGHFSFEGYEFEIVDLPGTYSLSAYSPEELYVREQIIEKTPDIVLNVVDVSNLERNLYLTTQLIDMNLRMVVALNMYDELEHSGNKLDHQLLGKLFGVPMVPTVCKTGEGVDMLFHIIINLYEGVDFLDDNGNINPEVQKELQDWHRQYHGDPAANELEHQEDFAHGIKPHGNVFRHIHINHGQDIETAIDNVKAELAKDEHIRHKYSLRYLSIKLLERDRKADELVKTLPNSQQIIAVRDRQCANILKSQNEDSETAIMNAKYGFIAGALQEAYEDSSAKDLRQSTKIIDSIVTNKIIGFPIFFFFMWIMFEATFRLGQYPMDWISDIVTWIGEFVHTYMSPGPLKDLLVDGIIGGVGGVIVFLPNILILYLFISFMEDSGYMARAAFIMDKIMHKMGLHGKSFIPLVMGFGCNVPAVMATRTIESRTSRMITMLITPLMSCSARLPLYILLTGAFFSKNASIVMLLLYVTGIFLAVVMARLFRRFLFNKEDTPFVMELPPYRMPTGKSILLHMWEKAKQYLKKMGGVILVASIIIWFLGYFPRTTVNSSRFEQEIAQVEQSNLDASAKSSQVEHLQQLMTIDHQQHSFIGQIGQAIQPIVSPLGFNWKISVSLLSGMAAKEVVVSTLSVLYTGNSDDSEVLSQRLTEDTNENGTPDFTPIVALSLMFFVLIYFPCIATITAIVKESGSWKWGALVIGYTCVLAWIVAFIVFQTGSLLVDLLK